MKRPGENLVERDREPPKDTGSHDWGRRAGLLSALLATLGLDYAALDDILTGMDPSIWTEGLWLVASVPVLVILIRQLRGKKDG